ncbi:hypothetical protein Brsp07_04573 [Brucella sp. NBRC 14130]|uniref:hypothetical protein n=1 Tax=Brucella sp. NBRC 14130 TaxID=3075483 RepID=UPI0030A2CBC9
MAKQADVVTDVAKAKALFQKALQDYQTGITTTSQKGRDAKLIHDILSEGGEAPTAVFATVFTDLYKVPRERATSRVQAALKLLTETKRVEVVSSSRPRFFKATAEASNG